MLCRVTPQLAASGRDLIDSRRNDVNSAVIELRAKHKGEKKITKLERDDDRTNDRSSRLFPRPRSRMLGGKFKRSSRAAQKPRKIACPRSPSLADAKIFLGTVVRCRSTTHDIFSSAAAKNTRIANFARRAERRPPSAVHLGRAAFSVQQGSFLSHRPDAPGQCALSRSLSFPTHPPVSLFPSASLISPLLFLASSGRGLRCLPEISMTNSRP